ncbi:hypothetical protein JNUCC0626_40485 [Lentzea sp. JNUCC 0626]|uniref:hypothetical protein n=1 Tax=Lentzea sp. JNUCC 0626 TaxID=3367513 RepID=UPI00374948C7
MAELGLGVGVAARCRAAETWSVEFARAGGSSQTWWTRSCCDTGLPACGRRAANRQRSLDYSAVSPTKAWDTGRVWNVPVGRDYADGQQHCAEGWSLQDDGTFKLLGRPCVENPI